MDGRGQRRWRAPPTLLLLVLAASGCGARAGSVPEPPPPESPASKSVPEQADPLAASGHRVTSGAAAGYVDDALCGNCHADLYEAYREVGMARSFFRPRLDVLVEDLESPGFFHEPSRRHYRMLWRDGRLIMRRHQIDASGAPINEIEQPVDWILGSGNHSRTYLFRTPWGELYQLPIAWYTQSGSWAMAPGFERADHLGLSRRVRRECMFCHNAYPDVPAGSDAAFEPHRFPEGLPEGVGCQRCHGPGEEHSRVAMREPVDFGRVYATIINPADLTPRLRNDVCYGCHMQPTVMIPGTRRFGRADYSFRPGQPLSDYLVALEVDEPGRERGERFEINHHPYRLEQSRCFAESDGRLSCLTCHDPHRKVPEADRAAHYRAACLGCHEVDSCRLEEMTAEAPGEVIEPGDCAGCHMSKRRTQDVIEVVMTDHLIRRQPGGPELVAPLTRTEPAIDDVLLREPERAPAGSLGEIYRYYAVASLTRGGHAEAVGRLEELLRVVRPPEIEPYLVLARGQLAQRRGEAGQSTLESILERFPDHPRARELLALTHDGFGRREEALGELRRVIKSGRDRPEVHYNLGAMLLRYGSPREALEQLERTVAMRPNMHQAWLLLGRARRRLDRRREAERGYRRALALEPTLAQSYLELGGLLLEMGRRDEALRYWRHGVDHAAHPEAIAAALDAATRDPGSRSPASSRR